MAAQRVSPGLRAMTVSKARGVACLRVWVRAVSACAGSAAINYFEAAFPEVVPFGTTGLFHNKAEWIVDLTTKVPLCLAPCLRCCPGLCASPLRHVPPHRRQV